jgi:hypothetical protein
MLQWMRERLKHHADKVVVPIKEKKMLEVAYKRALPRVTAVVEKKFPPAEMKILRKWQCTSECKKAKVQYPTGVVCEFTFEDGDQPTKVGGYEYRDQMYLVDAGDAAAIDAWQTAKEAYETERKKRLIAYKALIDGASTVEDLTDVWPEAKGILPAGSPPIPLGPEQIALVRADLKERKAA